MTTNKNAKRAARDLAAAQGLSYTSARRKLAATDAAPAAETSISPEYLDALRDEIGLGLVIVATLSQHTVACVGTALAAVRDSGLFATGRVEQVTAARYTTDPGRTCSCPDPAALLTAGQSFEVPLRFDKPFPHRFDRDATGFAEALSKELGDYSPSTTLWMPGHIDGTGVTFIDRETYRVAVTVPPDESVDLLYGGIAAVAAAAAVDESVRTIASGAYYSVDYDGVERIASNNAAAGVRRAAARLGWAEIPPDIQTRIDNALKLNR